MPRTTVPARDVCDPANSIGRTNFYCSLVCCGKDSVANGIGWPMESGTIQVELFSEDCFGDVGLASVYYNPSMYQIPLSCPHVDDVRAFTCTWTGKSEAYSNQGTVGLVAYGYKLRFTGSMTALDANTVSASFNMQRLVAAGDFIPPAASNSWTTCAGGSTTCYRVISPGVDPNNKQIPRTYVSSLFACGGGSVCGDVRYARLTVMLLPYKFGCAAADNKWCALSHSGDYYSCLRASVKPMTPGTFAPGFAQIGVNDPANCGTFGAARCGCFNGKLLPFGSYSLSPGDSNPLDLLSVGCTGEVENAEQQIQFRENVAGYDVIVKTVAGTAGICTAIRQTGTLPWTQGSLTVVPDSIPWTAYVDFPTVAGQPRLLLYGLKFPTGLVRDCVQDSTFPSPSAGLKYLVASDSSSPIMWGSNPYTMSYIDVGENGYRAMRSVDQDLGFDMPQERMVPPISPEQTATANENLRKVMERVSLRMSKTCRFVGKVIGPKLCCGTTELRECSVHGSCRHSGASVAGEKICTVNCDEWSTADA